MDKSLWLQYAITAYYERPTHLNDITEERRKFSQAEKDTFLKLFHGVSEDFPELSKQARLEKTAEFTGCGVETLERLLAEEEKRNQKKSKKGRSRKCTIQ